MIFKCLLVADAGCRFVEKGNLEVLLFTIQSKMRANNQKPYTPREGKMLADINRAWEELEKAEHERELALRDELIRCVRRFISFHESCSRCGLPPVECVIFNTVDGVIAICVKL